MPFVQLTIVDRFGRELIDRFGATVLSREVMFLPEPVLGSTEAEEVQTSTVEPTFEAGPFPRSEHYSNLISYTLPVFPGRRLGG